MITHGNLVQGTDAWNLFRANHHGASEASAMLGLSSKMTRNELLHIKKTGTPKQFSDFVESFVFAKGHEYERLARPIVEGLIGEELYPATATDDEDWLSASFDGLTIMDDVTFEHKQPSQELTESVKNGILPDEHWPQVQQQLMISGADKCLFTVSDGTKENMVSMWVYPDLGQQDKIFNGWLQFEKDLAEYEVVEKKDKPKGEMVVAFPTVSIQVKGELVMCNLTDVTPRFDQFLAKVSEYETDEHFVQADIDAKAARAASENLEATAQAVIDQILPVSDAVRTLQAYSKRFTEWAIEREKKVVDKKASIKDAIIQAAKAKFANEVAKLENTIQPIKLNAVPPDLQAAIKSLKTLESVQNAVDTCVANATIEADVLTRELISKLRWLKEKLSGDWLLFPDMQTVIYKDFDDLKLLVDSRLAESVRKQAEKTQESVSSEAVADKSQPSAPPYKGGSTKTSPTLSNAIDHGKDIADFLKTQNAPEKTLNTVRAYLVQFCKFLDAKDDPF